MALGHRTAPLGPQKYEKKEQHTGFSRSLTDGSAMQMSPSKGKAAVHGFHCPRDMAVRMRKVMARPWVELNSAVTGFGTRVFPVQAPTATALPRCHWPRDMAVRMP